MSFTIIVAFLIMLFGVAGLCYFCSTRSKARALVRWLSGVMHGLFVIVGFGLILKESETLGLVALPASVTVLLVTLNIALMTILTRTEILSLPPIKKLELKFKVVFLLILLISLFAKYICWLYGVIYAC